MQNSQASEQAFLALLRRDVERRAWLSSSFQGSVPPARDLADIEQIRARYGALSLVACEQTVSGLSGRAFFAAHVEAILQDEAEPSAFSIGFVKIRGGAQLDASVLRPMAQILREALRPEDHLAEVRPAIFGVIGPAMSDAALEKVLRICARSLASTTFFDIHVGESRSYEAEVAMGRLDGRRTVEDVFRDARRSAVFVPAAGGGMLAARLPR